MQEKSNTSVGRVVPLFGEILEDSQRLVSQEITLLKKDFFSEMDLYQKKIVYGIGRALAGIFLILTGVILLCVSAYGYVRASYPEIPSYSLLMISGLIALALSGLVYLITGQEK